MRRPHTVRAILFLVAVSGSLVLLPSLAVADSITINLTDTEITALNLTGTSNLPLASDPDNSEPGSVDGYGLVTTGVGITESASHQSTIETTVVVTTQDFGQNFHFAINANLNLFANLALTDQDGTRDFAIGLATSISAPNDPLNVELSSEFNIAYADLFTESITDLFNQNLTASSSTVEYPLGTDINGNVTNDVLKLTADNLDFILEDLLLSDVEIDLGAILDFVLNGGDPIIPASVHLEITGTTINFDGLVRDENTDPPFEISLSGDVTSERLQALPEPSAIVFAAVGLLGLFGVAWRSRRRG